jgi:hypothetical protein
MKTQFTAEQQAKLAKPRSVDESYRDLLATALPRVIHTEEENEHYIDVFGAKSVVSEVLSGKRDLSKSHIQKLSERFHISPEVSFSVPQ